MADKEYISVSLQLDRAGLVWHPEIGDEVSDRSNLEKIFILVDPCGYTPAELRKSYLWLPTVEQLVLQLEAREAMIYHAGINERFSYEAIIKTAEGIIETSAATLRLAFGKALSAILYNKPIGAIH